jgi:hypothetical protein
VIKKKWGTGRYTELETTDSIKLLPSERILTPSNKQTNMLKLIASQNVWYTFSYCLIFTTTCQRSYGQFIYRRLLPLGGQTDIIWHVVVKRRQYENFIKHFVKQSNLILVQLKKRSIYAQTLTWTIETLIIISLAPLVYWTFLQLLHKYSNWLFHKMLPETGHAHY